MKILIVYASKYGCTQKAVRKLATCFEGHGVQIVNVLEENNIPDLSKFDTVAIGGSIYAGRIQKEIRDYCSVNLDKLLEKNLGLFICAGLEEKAAEQLEESFPAELLDQAVARGYFGYEFNLDKMGFLAKIVVRILAKKFSNESNINNDSIKKFARQLME